MAVSHGLRVTRTGSAGQLNFGPVEQRFLGKAAAHQTISMLAVLPCERRTATPVGHGSRTTLLPLASSCARPLRHTLDCRRCAAPAAACRVPGGRSCSPIQTRPSRRGASESRRRRAACSPAGHRGRRRTARSSVAARALGHWTVWARAASS